MEQLSSSSHYSHQNRNHQQEKEQQQQKKNATGFVKPLLLYSVANIDICNAALRAYSGEKEDAEC